MGRKSRMKKERRKAKENLNRHQENWSSEMKWITKMTEEHWDWYDRNTFEKFGHIFKTKGEEGMRDYFKKYRSPVVCRNTYGAVFEVGWEVEKGRLFLFADARMVVDEQGRFECQDCGRRYFHCACLETDALQPFPVAQQRRGVLEWCQIQGPNHIELILPDNITNFSFAEGSLRS